LAAAAAMTADARKHNARARVRARAPLSPHQPTNRTMPIFHSMPGCEPCVSSGLMASLAFSGLFVGEAAAAGLAGLFAGDEAAAASFLAGDAIFYV